MISTYIKEMYNKYEPVVKYSTYAFAGWFLSWILFFIMVPVMFRYFGKVRGAFLNYIFSWISMFFIIVALTFIRPDNIYKTNINAK